MIQASSPNASDFFNGLLGALNLTFLLSQIVIGQLPTAGRVINQAHPSFAASPT
jgi:hypothetical protein